MPVSDRSRQPPCQFDDGDGAARPGCCGTTSRALPPGRFCPVLTGHTQVGREACLEYAGVSSEKGLWRGVNPKVGSVPTGLKPLVKVAICKQARKILARTSAGGRGPGGHSA